MEVLPGLGGCFPYFLEIDWVPDDDAEPWAAGLASCPIIPPTRNSRDCSRLRVAFMSNAISPLNLPAQFPDPCGLWLDEPAPKSDHLAARSPSSFPSIATPRIISPHMAIHAKPRVLLKPYHFGLASPFDL